MKKQFNFAIDIGTTNIEILLFSYDVLNGEEEIIDNIIQANNQKAYGKDVITRITNSRKENVLNDMNSLVIDQLNVMIESLLVRHSLTPAQIEKIAIVGNTTMLSILLNYDILSLGEFPFTISHKYSEILDASEFFAGFRDTKTKLTILGCASAFIGADAIAGYLFLNFGLEDIKNYRIVIDLGTNGEVILWNDEYIFADSAPCGPVFEKSLRSQNFMGTNLIDALAMGIKSKKINRDGTLIPKLFNTGITLYNINITMETIRETQLGLASLFTTIKALIQAANINFTDIDIVYVSGGFGSNLNVDNAIEVGLFPEDFRDKIKLYNNTALLGAKMACIDETFSRRLDRIIDRITVIKNGGNALFQSEYIKYLNFDKR